MPETDAKRAALANLTEDKDWSYHHTESDHPYPILFSYVRYTYRRLAGRRKIALSDDAQSSCFNLGLVTPGSLSPRELAMAKDANNSAKAPLNSASSSTK